MTDEELKALYQELAAEADRKGGERPDPAELLSALEGRGPEEDRLRVLALALSSTEGHRDLELLRVLMDGQGPQLAEEERNAGEGAAPTGNRRRWSLRGPFAWNLRRLMPVGVAATAVLAIMGVLRWSGSSGDPPAIRSGADRLELLAPAPDAVVTLPATLVWSRHPEAVEYLVEVMGVSGLPLAEVTVPGVDTTWVLDRVEGVESVRWWVRAILPTGSARPSELRELRIR